MDQPKFDGSELNEDERRVFERLGPLFEQDAVADGSDVGQQDRRI